MAKKHGNKETVKKTGIPDAEYSGNLTPSAGRLKEAGYGKTTDLELADVGEEVNSTQEGNRGIEGEGEINPLVTGIASMGATETNTKTEENFEFGDLKMGNNQLENDNAGLNRDYNDAPPSSGNTVGAGASRDLNEFGSLPDYEFEVGDLEKKEKKAPADEAQNQY